MREARELIPEDPEMPRQLVEIHRAAGQGREALLAALEGVLVTGSPTLFPTVAGLVAPDDRGCLFARTPGGQALNLRCPAVQGLACEAAANAVRMCLRARRQERARQIRESVAAVGCGQAESLSHR
jgi:hypothetical protein